MVMRKLQAGGTRTHSLPRQTVLTPSCISSLRTHLEGTWSQPSISSANLTSRRLRCTLATPSTTQRSVSRLWSDPRVVSGHGTERGFEPCLSRPTSSDLRQSSCGSESPRPPRSCLLRARWSSREPSRRTTRDSRRGNTLASSRSSASRQSSPTSRSRTSSAA